MEENNLGTALVISRQWGMPNHNTFDVKPIGEFVQKYLTNSRISVDPFSRNRDWATYTNDLNPGTSAQYHLEAADFLRSLVERGIKADLFIFDPPYSLEQCKRSYESVGRKVTMRDTQVWNRWTEHRDLILQMATPDAVVLSFGWNSNGMGKKRGFEPIELLLVPHGAGHNDTICMAERRVLGPNKGT